jgi:preprotein translocase subunit SecA
MDRMGMRDDEVIEHPWVNSSIENAQRRVEGHNFDVRKHLLEYDDVMNDQRGAVYKLRRRVLGADSAAVREMVLDWMEDCIINLVARCCPERSQLDEWDLTGLQSLSQELFASPVALTELADVTREALENHIYAAAEAGLQAREAQFGAEPLFHIGRIIALQTIDLLWKDHLREMDQLREGISLRGYAQKDPKQEYKKEGYNLFAAMMGAIGADVLQKLFRVVITAETEEQYQARLERQRAAQAEAQARAAAQAQRLQAGPSQRLPAGPSGPSVQAAGAQPANRRAAKVGRNDPCPCGSGKKYKKCHEAADALLN